MTRMYRKKYTAEHEACRILREEGWYATYCYGTGAPPDIIAVGPEGVKVITVRDSRVTVPDARTVSLLFEWELDRMRSFTGLDGLVPEAWIRSPPDGWKRYQVYPGGIWRIFPRDLPPDPGHHALLKKGMGPMVTWDSLIGPFSTLGEEEEPLNFPGPRVGGSTPLARVNKYA